MDFIFWFFLTGIVVALVQDFKRREVDNWLNYLLFAGGAAFLFFLTIDDGNWMRLVYALAAAVTCVLIANLFYYGRVFGGGDARLLIALFAAFVGAGFWATMLNTGLFIMLFLLAGSVYGLLWIFGMYFFNMKKMNVGITREFKDKKMKYIFGAGVVLFVLSYVNIIFLFFAILLIVLPLLFALAKSAEGIMMIKAVSARDLRQGDWLANSVKVGRKIVKPNWEGLTASELRLLKKLGVRKVRIKDGLPFVPAFLAAFLAYELVREGILGYLAGLLT